MAENRLTWTLGGLVVVLLLAFCYLLTRSQNAAEIARVEQTVARLQLEKDSIQAFVSANELVVETLRGTIDRTDGEADALRGYVDLLEERREEQTLSVRSLSKTSELQVRLAETLPEMARSNWGLTNIPLEPGDTLGIEYFLIPAWFTETFIIDHQNAESWREQKAQLLEVDSLRTLTAVLLDSVAVLHERNALALRTGYDNASTECRALSDYYIAELRKPRLSLGSTLGLCLGAAGAGLGIGTVINR